MRTLEAWYGVPDEEPVVQVFDPVGGRQWAELRVRGGKLEAELYPLKGVRAWVVDADELAKVIALARERLLGKVPATAAEREADPPMSDARADAAGEILALSDVGLLAACDAQWPEALQEELSGLLDAAREGEIDAEGRRRLDELMAKYSADLVRKAEALAAAVRRGLRPPLG